MKIIKAIGIAVVWAAAAYCLFGPDDIFARTIIGFALGIAAVNMTDVIWKV